MLYQAYALGKSDNGALSEIIVASFGSNLENEKRSSSLLP